MKKTFILRMMLLAFIYSTFSLSAGAQPMPSVDVVPGSKGVFDASKYPVAPEKTFSGLYVRQGCLDYDLSKVEYQLYLEDYSFNFDRNNRLVLEMQKDGSWVEIDSINHYNYSVDEPGTYRVKVAKGPWAGYVSNAVEADGIWAMNAFIRGSYREGAQWNIPHVGEILHRPKVYVRLYKDGRYKDYEDCTSGPDEDGFKSLGDRCVQKWYRYNPWTREKIELTPTARGNYKMTNEDVGCEIHYEIKGNSITGDFFYAFKCGIVKLPIISKPVYVNHDGIILNTDYALTNPEQLIEISYYDSETEKYVNVDFTAEEKQPGQYALLTDTLPEYANLNLRSDVAELDLYFDYIDIDNEDDFNSPFRPATIEAYPEALCAEVILDGDTVKDATIMAYRENLSGVMEETPLVANEWGDTGLLAGEYYLKVSADHAVDTYYPSADTWEKATAVRTNRKTEEVNFWERQDVVYTINLIPMPAVTTGPCTIKGYISAQTGAKARSLAPQQSDELTVFLKDKEGKLVAVTKTDATGSYAFENLPYGEYVVIPDVIGCTLENAHTVILKEGSENANDIDYGISGGKIIPQPVTGINAVKGSVVSHNKHLIGKKIVIEHNGKTYSIGGVRIKIKR